MLLINLGTPDAPEPAAVRRYLAEFLSDPRVIEIPQIAWKPILHGIILRTRPRKSAHAYSQIWEPDGSPLAAITARQARALQDRLGEEVMVEFLPAVCSIATFESSQPIYEGAEASEVVAVWFQSSFGLPEPGHVVDTIRDIEWETYACDLLSTT